jgi:phage shock protein PspC (stress-responsive transcriptional regulator)
MGNLPLFRDPCVHNVEIVMRQEQKMTTHQKQSLRRSRENRVIAGVCGGLADFFGISAFWFRLAMIITFIPGGVPGLLIYLLLWIIIPGE